MDRFLEDTQKYECPRLDHLEDAIKNISKDDAGTIKIESHLQDYVAEDMASASFECRVTGNNVKCTWFKNGQLISCSRRVKAMTQGNWKKLILMKVTISDIGVYTVLCTNDEAYSMSHAVLYVKKRTTIGWNNPRVSIEMPWPEHVIIKITKHLKNIRTRVGDPFELKLEFNARSEVEIKWFFNSRELMGQLNGFCMNDSPSSCEVWKYNSELSNSGIYTVVLLCADMCLSSTAHVIIMAPNHIPLPYHICPTFMEFFPEELEVYEGDEVLLMCKIYFDEFTVVDWYKNGCLLKDSKNIVAENFDNCKIALRIRKARISDVGIYSVAIRNQYNGYGCFAQCDLSVTRHLKEDFISNIQIKKPLKIFATSIGATIVLHCAFSYPKTHKYYVVWRIGMYKFERSTSKFKMVRHDGNYLVCINNVLPDMFGEVTCTLRRVIPTRTSSVPVVVTKGLLIHLPPDAMEEELLENSFIIAPKFFTDLRKEKSIVGWIEGITKEQHNSSSQVKDEAMSSTDKEDSLLATESLEIISKTSEMEPIAHSESSTDNTDLLMELLYCRFDDERIHYLHIDKCHRSIVVSVQTKEKDYAYDDDKMIVNIKWNPPDPPEQEWYAIEVPDSGKTYTTAGITTRSTFEIEDPTPHRLTAPRIRIITPLENVKESSVAIRPPTGSPPQWKKAPHLPIAEFDKMYTKIGEPVGKGAYGSVYVVENKNKKILAAKIIKARTDKRRESTRRELEITRFLSHEKVVTLVTSFYSQSDYILVMEYLWGGELFERIIEDEEFDERTAVHYISQVCSGLHYIHSKNIVHLDIKPENVVCVSRNSRDIKIVDFGLARAIQSKIVRAIYGTRDYIAPEVLNFEAIGPYSDMWSLGVMTYVMLSGTVPFSGATWNQRAVNITKGAFNFDDPAFDNVSADAIDFILSLMVLKPDERLTAVTARQHSWMVNTPSQAIGIGQTPRWRSNIRSYLEINRARWQRAGNVVIAANRLKNRAQRASTPDSRPPSVA